MNLRSLARRYLPYEGRLKVAALRRRVRDVRAGVIFAAVRGERGQFPNQICSYERLFVDYPGQEQFARAKRRNQALLAAHLSGAKIAPNEVFSVWHLAPRPSERNGYAVAAALKNRELTSEVGGAICLLSTVLYNVALLGGLVITERHCHSIDSYGENRYFELGRDAAIEYGYLDLRFRNPHRFPVLLMIEVNEASIRSSLHSQTPHAFRVEIEVAAPTRLPAGERIISDPRLPPGHREIRFSGLPGLCVEAARRTIYDDGTERKEQLESSLHNPVQALIAVGANT